VISRYLVIVLAFVAAGFRFLQGAWLEAVGLASLGLGLSFLKLSAHTPSLRLAAYVSFVVTALAISTALIRLYWNA
jgi:hypothetical protein